MRLLTNKYNNKSEEPKIDNWAKIQKESFQND
jgi:hypothetical protein